MKMISILTACYNEEENVQEVYEQVRKVMESLPYDYEHLFIDNASKDKTVDILREIARQDKRVRVIVNARNFGAVRSPFYALKQVRGDCVIGIVADLQDPPEMIPEFVKKWEEGYKMVLSVKIGSEESSIFYSVRCFYYWLSSKMSDVQLIRNATGSGLFDRAVIDVLKTIEDPYPYFRGLICEIGFEHAEIPYHQPRRKRGFTSNNIYTLLDLALLGITSHSKIPLRLATMTGFFIAALSLVAAFLYLIYKVFYWHNFQMGIAPLVIGLFFFSAVQLFFIGIVGEYVGAIHTQVLKRPLVVEKERINFDEE